MTNFSDVGIGIISYNRSEYLEKCLKSIYNSNINGAEVVVFDDHSQDNSFFIAKKYGKVVSPQSNGGVVRNKTELFITLLKPVQKNTLFFSKKMFMLIKRIG